MSWREWLEAKMGDLDDPTGPTIAGRYARECHAYITQLELVAEGRLEALRRARAQLGHLAGPETGNSREWPKRSDGIEHPFDTLAFIDVVLAAGTQESGDAHLHLPPPSDEPPIPGTKA